MNTLQSIQAEISYRNQQARRAADVVRMTRSGRVSRRIRGTTRRRDRRDGPSGAA